MRHRSLAPWVLAACALATLGAARDTTRFVAPWNREPTGSDIAIAPVGEPGPRLVISGRVFGLDSLPLAGATVYAYHTDAKGWYWIPPDERTVNRIGGVLRTGLHGEYRIRTIAPGRYSGGPHVHFEVWGPSVHRRVIAVNLYLKTGTEPDSALNRAWKGEFHRAERSWTPRMAVLEPDSSGGYRCTYDVDLTSMYVASPEDDSLRRVETLKLERLPRN